MTNSGRQLQRFDCLLRLVVAGQQQTHTLRDYQHADPLHDFLRGLNPMTSSRNCTFQAKLGKLSGPVW